MAIQLGGGDGDEIVAISDINVTPFIDVMLVLLIIFMVAAPLSTVDTPVNLPHSNAEQQPRPEKPVVLTLARDLSLRLGENPIEASALGQALDAQTKGDRSQRVLLQSDAAVAYGDVMNLMNRLRSAGYLKIALVGLEDQTGSASSHGAAAPAP